MKLGTKLIAAMGFLISLPALAQEIYPEDGWWWDPDASGRGYLLERQGEVIFMTSFHYTESGEPEWIRIQGTYAPDETDDENIGTVDAEVYRSDDGQCIGCDYVEPISMLSEQDPAIVTFHDNQNATLSWTNETVPLTRFFWGFSNSLEQLNGQWLLAVLGADTDPIVMIATIAADGATASITSDEDEALGSITLDEGDLSLSLTELSSDLPILVPETKRFYAGSRDADDDAVVALRIDDLPLQLSGDSTITPSEAVNASLFLTGALVEPVTTESCTLSGGTQTNCYRIEVAGAPSDREIGPFCPRTTSATADEVGIWFDGGAEVYDIDGAFIENLSTLYNDSNWQLYDPATGQVNVTETQEACEAAARPNVDPEYQNHCVECALEYVDGGVTQIILLPTEPVPLAAADDISNGDLGVTLNGVLLAPPAPVDAILSAYTIAAFDDCGGHVNPFAGYHYHAATGCTEVVEQPDDHAGLIGFTLDGYGLYGMLDAAGNESTDLDTCRGHTDDVRGYHYHAASASENMFIGCYNGEQGSIQ